jgi:hypothetical protein
LAAPPGGAKIQQQRGFVQAGVLAGLKNSRLRASLQTIQQLDKHTAAKAAHGPAARTDQPLWVLPRSYCMTM